MAVPPLVSVIIPHLAGTEILLRCLDSVQASEYSQIEIIIIDNGSTDGSVQQAQEKYPAVHVIRRDTNLGFAAGCNLGFSRGRGTYFLLLNDDAVLAADALSRMVAHAEAHPHIAAIQPKIKSLVHEGCFDYAGAAGGFLDIFGFSFTRGRLFETIEQDQGQYDMPREIFWASGACCLLRRRALAHCGFFDATFFAHMEEIDLNWRFHLAGMSVYVLPAAVAYHAAGSTLTQESPQKLYLNHRNNLLMLLKNYAPLTLAFVFPVRMLMELLALGLRLARFEFPAAAAIVRGDLAALLHLRHVLRERKRIQKLRVVRDRGVMQKMYRKSVVLQYYLLRRKTFRSLNFEQV